MAKAKSLNSANKLQQRQATATTSEATTNYTPTGWWGQAWQRNLASYAHCCKHFGYDLAALQTINVQGISFDRANKGDVLAYVQSQRQKPFEICIRFRPLLDMRWQNIISLCNNKIPDLDTLLSATFPSELGEVLTHKHLGLFPSPADIATACTCATWADMCRHTQAVLYAMSAKLDDNPDLLFDLRGINAQELFDANATSNLGYTINSTTQSSWRVLSDDYIPKLFKL